MRSTAAELHCLHPLLRLECSVPQVRPHSCRNMIRLPPEAHRGPAQGRQADRCGPCRPGQRRREPGRRPGRRSCRHTAGRGHAPPLHHPPGWRAWGQRHLLPTLPQWLLAVRHTGRGRGQGSARRSARRSRCTAHRCSGHRYRTAPCRGHQAARGPGPCRPKGTLGRPRRWAQGRQRAAAGAPAAGGSTGWLSRRWHWVVHSRPGQRLHCPLAVAPQLATPAGPRNRVREGRHTGRRPARRARHTCPAQARAAPAAAAPPHPPPAAPGLAPPWLRAG